MALDVGRLAADKEIDTELNDVPTDAPEPVDGGYRQKQSIQPFSDADNICFQTLSISDRTVKQNCLKQKHLKSQWMRDSPNASWGKEVRLSEKHFSRKCLQQECLKFKDNEDVRQQYKLWKAEDNGGRKDVWRPPRKLVGVVTHCPASGGSRKYVYWGNK
ncbi:unnamed protein product [Cuscuta epithymum]|uniref:Uncharacterized protein n=1 Tax=Cuscuta epithymum TaxID=186058 RepID=A0AAV0C3J0_9ASTE|nr:unnamed protein product [Cuscuta epithymum]